MKDFLGKELEIGDEVVIIEKGYRDFIKGKILRFTEKQLVVSYYDKYETRRYPSAVIKI